MSLRAPVFYLIPEQTVQVAQAAFPKGNPYMRMRDVLGPIYSNAEFAPLFKKEGRPVQAPAQLALVTIMQFAEGLSDAQAADAVRSRIDWKCATRYGGPHVKHNLESRYPSGCFPSLTRNV